MRPIMQIKIIWLCFMSCLVLSGCVGMNRPEQVKSSLLDMESIVQGIQGREVIVATRYPEVIKGSAIDDIAQEVIRKTILLEGMRIICDGRTAVVKEVRNDTARFEFESPPPFTVGTVLRLTIPKKTIAIVDFEVIKGNQKDTGRVTLEGLTAALIESGQFIVVEREKLKTVISELQLSLSGLARKTSDQIIGDLFVADLILTGSFAQVQDDWDIRLRILNVRNGQAIAAISKRTKLFPVSEFRDSSAFFEDFERDFLDTSWLQRSFGDNKKRLKAFYNVSLDKTQGADNSRNSVRIDFNCPEDMDRSFIPGLENLKKRDLSLYSGIEFWVKGTEDLNGQFIMDCSQPDDIKKRMRWTGFLKIGTEWTKVNIPFDKLVVGRRWVRQGAARQGFIPGDEILRLHRVESFKIGIDRDKNPDTQGAFWIDNIHFY
jgi:hypothetical protein